MQIPNEWGDSIWHMGLALQIEASFEFLDSVKPPNKTLSPQHRTTTPTRPFHRSKRAPPKGFGRVRPSCYRTSHTTSNDSASRYVVNNSLTWLNFTHYQSIPRIISVWFAIYLFLHLQNFHALSVFCTFFFSTVSCERSWVFSQRSPLLARIVRPPSHYFILGFFSPRLCHIFSLPAKLRQT